MNELTGADFKSATAADNKKLFIETYGCQMNVADSEVIASVMQMAGYSVAETLEEADAVFMNTCSIRDNAEQKILNRLEFFHSLKKKKKRLIVGVLGCMAERVKDDLITNHHVDLVVGPDAYLTLPDLIAAVEAGEKAINVELSTTETYRDVIPSRICGNHISGFVSIMRGCNNFCTYCIVPYTRGRERSRDVESILNEVSDLVAKGYKEVTLLGQNVNSYRFEKPTGEIVTFPMLLRTVAEAAPGVRIRFTTSHPKDMSDETLEVIAQVPNVCIQRRTAVGVVILDAQVLGLLGVDEGSGEGVLLGHDGIVVLKAVLCQHFLHLCVRARGDLIDHAPGEGDLGLVLHIGQELSGHQTLLHPLCSVGVDGSLDLIAVVRAVIHALHGQGQLAGLEALVQQSGDLAHGQHGGQAALQVSGSNAVALLGDGKGDHLQAGVLEDLHL